VLLDAALAVAEAIALIDRVVGDYILHRLVEAQPAYLWADGNALRNVPFTLTQQIDALPPFCPSARFPRAAGRRGSSESTRSCRSCRVVEVHPSRTAFTF
jgi:hypothetical protein